MGMHECERLTSLPKLTRLLRILRTWDIRVVASGIDSTNIIYQGGTSVPCRVSCDPTVFTLDTAGNLVLGTGRSRAIASVALDQTGSIAWGLGRNGR